MARFVSRTHDSQPTCGTTGLANQGEDRFSIVWEEVSSLAADALPPTRPSSAGLFEAVTKLKSGNSRGKNATTLADAFKIAPLRFWPRSIRRDAALPLV
jgi:hypothetical protein